MSTTEYPIFTKECPILLEVQFNTDHSIPSNYKTVFSNFYRTKEEADNVGETLMSLFSNNSNINKTVEGIRYLVNHRVSNQISLDRR